MSLLVIYSWQDIHEKKITIVKLVAGFMIAFVMGVMFRQNGSLQELKVNIGLGIQGMLPGVFLVLLTLLMKGCMGLGDGLVLVIIGSLIGFKRAIGMLVIALFFSFLYSCMLIICKKKKESFPFVPFYLLAILLMWSGI